MKRSTTVILLLAIGLVILGTVLGGIGWSLSPDPLAELSGISISGTDFRGGRDLHNEFHTDGQYAADSEVTGLHVEWVAGSVTLKPYDGDEIQFVETSEDTLTEQTALRWGVEGDTLYIQYCQRNAGDELPVKALEIRIPAELAFTTLVMNTVSADVTGAGLSAEALEVSTTSGWVKLSDMTCGSVDLGSTSGNIEFAGTADVIEANSTSGQVDVDQIGGSAMLTADTTSGDMTLTGNYTAVCVSSGSGQIVSDGLFAAKLLQADTTSGDVFLAGSLEEVEISTASGKVSLDSDSALQQVQVDTTSGDVALTVPADSGFTLQYDTASGDLNCQLPLQIKSDSRYICGDGADSIVVNTASGDLNIASR